MSGYYPPSLEPKPASVALAADLPCHKCRSSLRGLASDGRCPKCGLAVSLSLHGDLLRYCDPAWIGRLRLGAMLVIWGFITAVLALAAAFVCTSVQPIGAPISLAVFFAALAMDIIGLWLLTWPDPSGLGENKYGRMRKLIRILTVFPILVAGLFGAAKMTAGPENLIRWMPFILLAGQLIGLASLLVQLKYLSKLALRISDTLLSERAQFLLRAIGIGCGVWIIARLLSLPILATSSDDSFVDCLSFVYMFASTCVLVFVVMNMMLLERFARRFKEQARLARQAWNGT